MNDKTAKVGASVFGQTMKLALSNWETWMVYTSESVTWKLSSGNEVKVRPLVGGASVFVAAKGVPTSTHNVCAPCWSSQWKPWSHKAVIWGLWYHSFISGKATRGGEGDANATWFLAACVSRTTVRLVRPRLRM